MWHAWANRVFVDECEEQNVLYSWKDKIKMDVKEIELEGWALDSCG